MQAVPKWKVTVVLTADRQVVLWIHDNHLSNVLRQVSNMQFTENGLTQPLEIIVSGVMNG